MRNMATNINEQFMADMADLFNISEDITEIVQNRLASGNCMNCDAEHASHPHEHLTYVYYLCDECEALSED